MSLIKHTFKRVEHMIAAPRDPHEEEQARLQENLFNGDHEVHWSDTGF